MLSAPPSVLADVAALVRTAVFGEIVAAGGGSVGIEADIPARILASASCGDLGDPAVVSATAASGAFTLSFVLTLAGGGGGDDAYRQISVALTYTVGPTGDRQVV
jgi:hypothetical protein